MKISTALRNYVVTHENYLDVVAHASACMLAGSYVEIAGHVYTVRSGILHSDGSPMYAMPDGGIPSFVRGAIIMASKGGAA
jgi:hypothetical protein